MSHADGGPATTIYVDADACPVKEETLKVAERHGLPVVIVSNGGLRPSRDPLVRHVIVPKDPDAADDWIAERAGPGDIVVTGDIPLAARAVAAGAAALAPDGRPFTGDSIGMAVAMRNLKQELREAGVLAERHGSHGPRARSRFLGELDRLVRRAARRPSEPPAPR